MENKIKKAKSALAKASSDYEYMKSEASKNSSFKGQAKGLQEKVVKLAAVYQKLVQKKAK